MARLFLAALLAPAALAYHDCVQPKAREWPYDARVTAPAMRSLFRRPGAGEAAAALRRGDAAPLAALAAEAAAASPPPGCAGGLCVGMHGGPHENGPAHYEAGSPATGFTSLYSTQTVPALPLRQDGICYYLWTDLFMGDMSWGRMKQVLAARARAKRLPAHTRVLSPRD